MAILGNGPTGPVPFGADRVAGSRIEVADLSVKNEE